MPDTAYIKITLEKLDGTNITGADVKASKFQLEYGSSSTIYTPYIEEELSGAVNGHYIINGAVDAPYLNLSVNNPEIKIKINYQQSWNQLQLMNKIWNSI